MAKVTVYRKTTGVDTSVDPSEIEYNPDSGVSALAVGVNIDVTNSGRAEITQSGYLQHTPGSFHSAWRDKGDAFVGKGTELYALLPGKILSLVRSGMSGNRIDFTQIGPETYYGNGYQHGVIISKTALPWPTTTNFLEKISVLDPVPPPNHLAEADGRIYFSVDNMFCWTELLAYGVYSPSMNFIMFGSYIRMIKPVDGGIFLSTNNNTWFLSGHDPHKFKQSYRPVGPPAHEWSVSSEYRRGIEVGINGGQCAFWGSDEGSCMGTPSGDVVIMNKDRIVFPKCNRGAGFIYGDQFIHTMWEI